MNTRFLSALAVTVLGSQALAMSHSGWNFSGAYGVLMPTDSNSKWTIVADADQEMKLKNVNFFDLGLTHAKSGFGLMYSSTAKDAKFTNTSTTPVVGSDTFVWNYRGYYATYTHPLGQMLDMNLAVGSVKQTLSNTAHTSTELKAKNNDLGARVAIGAFYSLSKESALKLSLSYNYFKEFTASYDSNDAADAAPSTITAEPKFDASGLAASIALVYSS